MSQGREIQQISQSFETFFAGSQHVSFLQDMQGIIQNCNDSASSTFGFKSNDSMIGKTPFDFQCQAVERAEKFAKLDEIVSKDRKTLKVIISDVYSYGADIHIVEKTPIVESGKMLGILTCGQAMKTSHALGSIVAHLSKKYREKGDTTQKVYTLGYTDTEVRLTRQEQECLFYLSHGMSAKEIANILCRSYRTIEKHLSQIRYKMNCVNRRELIEKSIMQGYADKIPQSLLSKKFILFL